MLTRRYSKNSEVVNVNHIVLQSTVTIVGIFWLAIHINTSCPHVHPTIPTLGVYKKAPIRTVQPEEGPQVSP